DARNQQWHVSDTGANLGDLLRHCGAHYQGTLAVRVPALCHLVGDVQVERGAVFQPQILQIRAAGVGGTAEDDHPFVAIFQIRLYGVVPHVGIDRHRVGGVALERFAGILGGGSADVAALGIQHDGQVRVSTANVSADIQKL